MKAEPAVRMTVSDGRIVSAFSSRLGWMAVVWRGTGVQQTSFGHRGVSAALRAVGVSPEAMGVPGERTDLAALLAAGAGQIEELAGRLQAYAVGEWDDFSDVPLADELTSSFARRVVDHCRAIRPGQQRTYRELAVLAGSPRAARAVGRVMARNRVPLIVPCHRVVGSGGALTGFSAPGGLETKRRLLALEQQMVGPPPDP